MAEVLKVVLWGQELTERRVTPLEKTGLHRQTWHGSLGICAGDKTRCNGR